MKVIGMDDLIYMARLALPYRPGALLTSASPHDCSNHSMDYLCLAPGSRPPSAHDEERHGGGIT